MIILDASATLALAQGHKVLNQLAANMARTPRDRLWVPALCLMQAELEDADAGSKVLSYSAVSIDDLATVAAVGVGVLVRDGYGGPDTCHALYCASPRAESPVMSILLTGHEDRYPPGVVTVDIDSPGMLGHH